LEHLKGLKKLEKLQTLFVNPSRGVGLAAP
jgi:hypothetical protein